MICNSTCTIYRHGTGYDLCGNIITDAQDLLCEDVEAMFSQTPFQNRYSHSSGMLEYSAPRYQMCLPCCADQTIRVGDLVDVTSCDGLTETFKIEDAVFDCGITLKAWIFSLEKVKSPLKTSTSCLV